MPSENGYKLNKNVAQTAIIRPRLRAFAGAPPRGASERSDEIGSLALQGLPARAPASRLHCRRQRRPVKGSSNCCIQHRKLSWIELFKFYA